MGRRLISRVVTLVAVLLIAVGGIGAAENGPQTGFGMTSLAAASELVDNHQEPCTGNGSALADALCHAVCASAAALPPASSGPLFTSLTWPRQAPFGDLLAREAEPEPHPPRSSGLS
jgi:hypothetical protein